MRVLAVTEDLPYPPDSGWKLRTWNLLSRLVAEHSITIVAHADPRHAEVATELRRQGFRVVPVSRTPVRKAGPRFYLSLLANLAEREPYLVRRHSSPRLRRRIAELLEGEPLDVVHCDWTPLMANIPSGASVNTVVTAHNIESEIWRRYLDVEKGPLRRWYIGRQLREMTAFERQALNAAKVLVTVSDRDADLARHVFGCSSLRVVENGVDLDLFTPSWEGGQRGRLIYTGSMDTIANADAVTWFVSEIMPLVVQAHSGVTLDIVGRNPSGPVKGLAARNGIRVTGAVADVRPYYAQAEVVIVPLRVGSGTRVKILEAWAAGRPVVATSLACEGLAARHERNLLVADDALAFARAVSRLLGDPRLRRGLARAGRETAEALYDWRALARKLGSVWQEVAAGQELAECAS